MQIEGAEGKWDVLGNLSLSYCTHISRCTWSSPVSMDATTRWGRGVKKMTLWIRWVSFSFFILAIAAYAQPQMSCLSFYSISKDAQALGRGVPLYLNWPSAIGFGGWVFRMRLILVILSCWHSFFTFIAIEFFNHSNCSICIPVILLCFIPELLQFSVNVILAMFILLLCRCSVS